jgi:hypothetical protein
MISFGTRSLAARWLAFLPQGDMELSDRLCQIEIRTVWCGLPSEQIVQMLPVPFLERALPLSSVSLDLEPRAISCTIEAGVV